MKTIKLLTLFWLLFTSTIIYAQSDFPSFGSFNAEEINLKQCDFDPEAEAIILLDKAVVNYGEDYEMLTERRIRIKILNDKGLDRANIIIPFYTKDDYEHISKVEAYTFNFNQAGAEAPIMVDKKSIYTEKRNNLYSLIKFAMPAVKVGSIIEYHYLSTMKSYSGLEDWTFQNDLPTLNSNFLLHVLPRAEFAYTVQKKRDYRIEIKPMPDQGMVYFAMEKLPALREEPYMDARRDYVQKVMFQFSGYLSASGSKIDVNTTWRSTAYELMSDKSFGSQLDKDLKLPEIKRLVQNETTEFGKVKAIYDYVKANFVWNGYQSRYAINTIKNIWDKKSGTNGELNLLLVNLLTTSGLETYPVLVAERNYGKIDTTYPFLDKFNKPVAFVIADGKQYLLDATQDYCPVGLTPYPILGTSAFLVDKKKFSIIKISPGNKSYKNVININGTIDGRGMVTAEAEAKSYDYSRQKRMESLKYDKKRFINEYFEKPYDGLTIDSFLVVPPEDDTMALRQVIRYKQQLNESGGYLFVNCNLFTGLEKNPFISNIRFTNVNFGYPYHIVVEESFKLPEGAKVEIPEGRVIRSADNKIEVIKQVSVENGELKVYLRFVQTLTLVRSDDYNGLKNFYKEMIDILNEPVLLKLAN